MTQRVCLPTGNMEKKRVERQLQRIDRAISTRLLKLQDAFIDRKVCQRVLIPYVPSIYRDDENGIGGTGTESTHYAFLRQIFAHVNLTESDTLIDVGCGKGRVLAFLLWKKFPCQLYGIEHNEEVANIALEWAEKYDQVHVTVGDAFAQDYNPYTVLSLARSFLPKTFLAFAEYLERTMKHPIRLVLWYGQEYSYLDGRPGWKLQERGMVDRVCGIRVGHGYSIWTLEPSQCRECVSEVEA